MEQAQLVTPLDDGTTRCDACQWRCTLGVGNLGRCLVRIGTSDGIQVLNYGLVSGATISPIEDFRLWHLLPDSLVLSIGGWGYAFPADQQRGQYATPPSTDEKQRKLDADKAANVALEKLCRGIVWAYGEPAVAYEYVLDLLKSSRANSRYTALVTTGFMTTEALDALGPYLDAISLDLRGFSDSSYSRLAGVHHWRGILDIATQASERWRCHIEVTTRVHRGVNDSPEELRALVGWMRDALGPQVPWHVLPGDAGAETAAAVARARRIGHEGGLQFIYGPEPNQETRCPSCQATLITRDHKVTRTLGLTDESCASCGARIYVRTSIFKRR